ATKVVYRLPQQPSELLQPQSLEKGRHQVSLGDWRGEDFSHSDFVYCDVENPDHAKWTLTLSDTRGRTVTVTNGDSHFEHGLVSTWSMGAPNIRWLPDMQIPQHAAAVDASGARSRGESVVAVSVHDLACAGLDIRRVTNASLIVLATN